MNPNDPRQPNKPFQSGDQLRLDGKLWHVCGIVYQYGQRCLDLMQIVPEGVQLMKPAEHRIIPYEDVLVKIIHDELTNPENMS